MSALAAFARAISCSILLLSVHSSWLRNSFARSPAVHQPEKPVERDPTICRLAQRVRASLVLTVQGRSFGPASGWLQRACGAIQLLAGGELCADVKMRPRCAKAAQNCTAARERMRAGRFLPTVCETQRDRCAANLLERQLMVLNS